MGVIYFRISDKTYIEGEPTIEQDLQKWGGTSLKGRDITQDIKKLESLDNLDQALSSLKQDIENSIDDLKNKVVNEANPADLRDLYNKLENLRTTLMNETDPKDLLDLYNQLVSIDGKVATDDTLDDIKKFTDQMSNAAVIVEGNVSEASNDPPSLTAEQINGEDPFVEDTLTGEAVAIVRGSGSGQVRFITGNTGTQLFVSNSWTVIPSGSSVYLVIRAVDAKVGEVKEVPDSPYTMLGRLKSVEDKLESVESKLENVEARIKEQGVAEVKTEADAEGDPPTTLIFDEPIKAVEISHDEDTRQNFVVNGITIPLAPSPGWRSSIEGDESNEVTIPEGISCVVKRLV